MSWFRYWWRTQQTAISEMSCRIQWIIKCSNANGTLGWPLGVCLFEYQFSLLTTFRCFTRLSFILFMYVRRRVGGACGVWARELVWYLKPIKQAFELQEKREEKWWEKSIAFIVCVLFPHISHCPWVLYCLKRMMLHRCVWPVLAERAQEKQNNENEFSFLFFTWCVSVTRQFLCGKENSLHSRCDLSVQFFSNKPFCRGAIMRKHKKNASRFDNSPDWNNKKEKRKPHSDLKSDRETPWI